MDQTHARETRFSSLPSDNLLSAHSDRWINNDRRRSTSVATSHRSSQSHITTVEEKEDIPGFDVSDIKKQRLQRQQTYKFGRTLSLMDRLRGVFSPQWLMNQMERSIEFSPAQVSDDEGPRATKSPWIVNIHVSLKENSVRFYQARCLIDTGCLHGNIVSKDLVMKLGYSEEDYQELTEMESRDAITLAGDPFPVEAAILLSWHHDTSLRRFCQMRFLVSSQAKNYDMVIGAETIKKYKLLSRPVFSLDTVDLGLGVANYSIRDRSLNYLVIDRSTLQSHIKNVGRDMKKEINKGKLGPLEKSQQEAKHLLKLKNIEIDLRSAENKEALQTELGKVVKDWDTEYPKNTTEQVAKRFWANRKQAPPSNPPSKETHAESSGNQKSKANNSSTASSGKRPRQT